MTFEAEGSKGTSSMKTAAERLEREKNRRNDLSGDNSSSLGER